jgi:hypothetical protein
LKSATDPISIENSLSAEIGQVTDFRGLKSDRWPISVMEIRSLNGPLTFAFDDFKSLLQNFSLLWTGSKLGNFRLGNGER